jgi:hypothetical protein
VGAVEAGANSGSQSASLTSTLAGAGAPQLVTLSLSAPSLGAVPGLLPAALAPTPLIAAAPYAAVALAPSPMPAALPASYISPARPVEIKPAPLAGAKSLLGDAPADLAKTSDGELIDYTKRLFGESSKAGYLSADYLRPGAPFQFGASEVFRYRTALNAYGAKSDPAAIATLVDAAAGLADTAGIAYERVVREGLDGAKVPALSVLPNPKGHRLNRLAWDLKRSFDSAVEYSPRRTAGGVAAYNSADKTLFLPDFGRDDAFEAILHESRHAYFAKRLRRGDVSAFHGALLAYSGRSIAPNAMSYDSYMSLEELSTHVKTVLHAVQRARRADGPGARDAAVADAKKYAFQLMDVLRSAEINLFQLQRKLEKGDIASYPAKNPAWPDFPGGHWEAINLPHAMLVLPVLDEAAPKRDLWSRVFGAKPQTPAMKAALRHASALRPLIRELGAELETFLGALKEGEPNLPAARDSAGRMTSFAAKADRLFASAP